jgi:hypothetical protein
MRRSESKGRGEEEREEKGDGRDEGMRGRGFEEMRG